MRPGSRQRWCRRRTAAGLAITAEAVVWNETYLSLRDFLQRATADLNGFAGTTEGSGGSVVATLGAVAGFAGGTVGVVLPSFGVAMGSVSGAASLAALVFPTEDAVSNEPLVLSGGTDGAGDPSALVQSEWSRGSLPGIGTMGSGPHGPYDAYRSLVDLLVDLLLLESETAHRIADTCLDIASDFQSTDQDRASELDELVTQWDTIPVPQVNTPGS